MRNNKAICLLLLCGLVTLTSSGCASIFATGTKTVQVKSIPDGATVAIYNWKGEHIQTATAPFTTVPLERGSGYFKAAEHEFRGTLPGRPDCTRTPKSGITAWYWGNILFGGLIGMLIVDPLTGAMYDPPNEVILNFSEPQSSDAGRMPGEAMWYVERDRRIQLALARQRIPLRE